MEHLNNSNLTLSEISDIIFNDLSRKILKCCEIMKNDYFIKKEKLPNHEEKIRNILLNDYLNNDSLRYNLGLSNYRFIDEKPVNFNKQTSTNDGRVDIMIITLDWFQKADNYYVIECKRIDGKSTLSKKFVEEGICRFTKEPILYKSYNKKNFMLGFIVENKEINDIIDKINYFINQNSDISLIKTFELVDIENKVSNSSIADSLYNLPEYKLLLRCLFYNFSSVIN